jgi:acyl carrier protein
MRERVRETIASVWGVTADDVPPDASAQTFDGWDSLRHLELMLELELGFGVRIPADQVPQLTSVAAIEDALRAHGVA